MTDPARAQLKERLLAMADYLEGKIQLGRLTECADLLREAASRLGEPEAPAPKAMFIEGWMACEFMTGVLSAEEAWDQRNGKSVILPSHPQRVITTDTVTGVQKEHVTRCQTHGPLPGLRYCPECASSGEPWTDAQADAADASPLVRTSQLVDQDQDSETRGGNQAAVERLQSSAASPEVLSATAPDWQPIWTAPQDGTRVLGFGGTNELYWRMVVRTRNQWEGWYTDPGKYRVNPTHWLPLPAPPQQRTT